MFIHCDYHLHTHLSNDCEIPMALQLKTAKEHGLTEVCFTDHLETDFPNLVGENLNFETYDKTLAALDRLGMTVRKGVENGLPCHKESYPKMVEELRSHHFDFILTSAHLVDDRDPYFPEYYEGGMTLHEALNKYTSALYQYLQWIPYDCYDAVGHIDYGAKFYPDPEARMHYADCPDQIDAIFRHIIPEGKCIEINTSTYRTITGPIPGLDWLKRYKELGGEFVTIGSDAHLTKHVAFRLDEAAELARAAGIRYYATFEDRKPILHKL